MTTTLQNFTTAPLFEAGIALFEALGYNTQRRQRLPESTAAVFQEQFGELGAKARTDQWQSVELLFQLTQGDMSLQNDMFRVDFQQDLIQSYLIVAIELCGESYNRSALTDIVREVNRLFSMPVLVLFRYGACITLSVIDRRMNLRDNSRDVITSRISHIKDIHLTHTHRAHVDILNDLALSNLQRQYTVHNFEDLHKAWMKVLDTKELNKRFYKELFNWYLWATQNVQFPKPAHDATEAETHTAQSVIRLLTRLVFVWFIKEKHIVTEAIFDTRKLETILQNFRCFK